MKTRTILLQSLLALVPIAYYLFIWRELPDTVPMHYNENNEVNDWGTKYELLTALLLITLITIGTSALIINIDKLDPKKKFSANSAVIKKISWAVAIFVTLIGALVVYDTQQYVRTNSPAELLSPKFVLAFVSLLFVVIGNFMNNIKPNYFVGIRTPWNLEDEDNWRRTHHLSSKLWFFGGLAMIAVILSIPETAAFYVFTGMIIPLVAIPFLYSFNIYRKKPAK